MKISEISKIGERMAFAVSRYNAGLPAASQKYLAESLASFAGKEEANAVTCHATVGAYKAKGEGKERYNASREVRKVVLDYGTSPMGLQLAAYYGAEKLELSTGCRINDVGIVPGVRTEPLKPVAAKPVAAKCVGTISE